MPFVYACREVRLGLVLDEVSTLISIVHRCCVRILTSRIDL